MSTAFELAETGHFVSIVLNPALGNSKWGDIEQAGNDLKTIITELDRAIVLMDLSALEFMSSSVVALIIKVWKVIESRKGGMVVVSPNELTLEVLEISGLTKLWPVVDSRSEAEEILARPPYAVPTGMATFLLAILGWVAAAGAVGSVVVLKQKLDTFDARTAQQMAFGCGGFAALIGLVCMIREKQVWRLLGILLLIVAVGMIGAAAI